MCHRVYVVAKEINGELNYLREESGDDCFADDLGCAIQYDFIKDIPLLFTNEFIVIVQACDDGSLEVLTGI